MNSVRRSTSRGFPTVMSLATLLLAGAACAEMTSTEPAMRPTNASPAHVAQTSVCHLNDTGAFQMLAVNARAVPGHRSHGDALPGESVPGRPGYQFDPACVARIVATDLTGEWTGTYSWNCGGTLTGSAAIRFVLDDPGTGRIAGTVSYRGGNGALFDSYRLTNPIYRPDGTLFFGTVHPDGMHVRLSVHAVPGHFVYNQFDGVIAPDFQSISGGTLNGDSAVPFSDGCSAAVGYSGTFSITRAN